MASQQGDQPHDQAFQGISPFEGMASQQGAQPHDQGSGIVSNEHQRGMTQDGSKEDPQDQKKYETLFKLAMRGDWNKLMEEYKNNPQAQKAKITSAEDTILHIAVTDEKTEIVTKLVESLKDRKVLEIRNDMGNTPLHLAAATGKVAMCKCMVDKHRDLLALRNSQGETPLDLLEIRNKYGETPLDLLEIRNKYGETPLFLAALHGKKYAFLYLHSQCPEGHGSHYWRRNDGNNVLHVAILGEYFDLAFQIIKKYKREEDKSKEDNADLDLINFRNERGQLALHLLANNPSAFKSGSHLGRVERIIYHCIVVEPLVEIPKGHYEDESETNHKIKLPDNYTAFADLCALLKRLFHFSPVPYWLWTPPRSQQRDQENPQSPTHGPADGSKTNESEGQSHNNNGHPFPPNYTTCYGLFELGLVFLQVLGFGFIRTYRIKEKKQKHSWAVQIMKELVSQASAWKYNATGSQPQDRDSGWQMPDDPGKETVSPDRKVGKEEDMTKILQRLLNIFPTSEAELMRDGKNTVVLKTENMQPRMHRLVMEMTKENADVGAKETAFLVAAKHGVKEIVETILENFPVAIRDVDADCKNVVLLAVENRQTNVYKMLLEKKYGTKDTTFQHVDKEGNSALHFAAKLSPNKPWMIPGAALQMQWEIKWYKYVKDSMPRHFFTRLNNKGQTSKEVFSETHKDLVKDSGVWLTNTSQSCSVVAALIATVAFATATTVPGGANQTTGRPTLEGEPAFDVFAIASLVALCFSVTALTMFLAILTSRYQESDFHISLPSKLIIGLTALFISIASILVSFCAGHFFVLEEQLKYAAFPVYAVTCLPITLFAAAQLPLYWDLIRSSITAVPKRTSEVTSLK